MSRIFSCHGISGFWTSFPQSLGHQAPGGIRWVTPITVTLIPPLDFAQYLVIAPYFSHSHGKNHGIPWPTYRWLTWNLYIYIPMKIAHSSPRQLSAWRCWPMALYCGRFGRLGMFPGKRATWVRAFPVWVATYSDDNLCFACFVHMHMRAHAYVYTYSMCTIYNI